MKTTTQQAAINRLNKIANKSTVAYKKVLFSIESKGSLIRPVYTSGTGKYTSNQDHTSSIKSLLNQIGIEFLVGNDAPRGGSTGSFIKIVTKIK